MQKSRNYTIVATPNGEKFGFQILKPDGQPTTSLTFDKGKDRMPSGETYRVTFDLQTSPDPGIRFCEKPADVIWVGPVTAGQSGPTTPSSVPQIHSPVVYNNNCSLDFTNTDTDVCDYGFSLNFVKTADLQKPAPNYIRFDPIISNKNGGAQRVNLALFIGIGAIALTALVVLAIWSSRR